MSTVPRTGVLAHRATQFGEGVEAQAIEFLEGPALFSNAGGAVSKASGAVDNGFAATEAIHERPDKNCNMSRNASLAKQLRNHIAPYSTVLRRLRSAGVWSGGDMAHHIRDLILDAFGGSA